MRYFALGGWIRVGVAGAFAVLSSPVLALAGELGVQDALLVASAGAAATALAWWRVNALLGDRRATTPRRLRAAAQA